MGPSARVQASSVDKSTVSLIWSGASDDLGIAGYRIYENGQLLTGTARDRYGAVVEAYTVTGPSSGTTYDFNVIAVDVANNTSAGGLSLDVTTPAQWWQITSLAWWQVNWFWAVALCGCGVAILAWMFLRRENLKQKRLTDFSKSNTLPVLAILHRTQILFSR